MSWYSGSHETIVSPTPSSAAVQQASMFADSTRSGIITPFGSLVEPLVYWRMTSRSGSCAGISSGRLTARSVRLAAWSPSARSADRPQQRRRTRRAGRRSGPAWRRRGGFGPGSSSTNSSSEPIRIGSGSTIEAIPASQQPRTIVISSRLVGPSTATWSPGSTPLAWSAAATASASSWIWRHDTWTGPSGATEWPTNRTPVPRSAACSRRSIVDIDEAVELMVTTLLGGRRDDARTT